MFLNNKHPPQWMLCCQGSICESLKGLCLHMGKISDLRHQCFHNHIFHINSNLNHKVSVSGEVGKVWAEDWGKKTQLMTMCLTANDRCFSSLENVRQLARVQPHPDSISVTEARASFGHLNYPLQTHLDGRFFLFCLLSNCSVQLYVGKYPHTISFWLLVCKLESNTYCSLNIDH